MRPPLAKFMSDVIGHSHLLPPSLLLSTRLCLAHSQLPRRRLPSTRILAPHILLSLSSRLAARLSHPRSHHVVQIYARRRSLLGRPDTTEPHLCESHYGALRCPAFHAALIEASAQRHRRLRGRACVAGPVGLRYAQRFSEGPTTSMVHTMPVRYDEHSTLDTLRLQWPTSSSGMSTRAPLLRSSRPCMNAWPR